MPKPKSDYAIQTVSNAVRLLETFYEGDQLGVSELSRRLGLHKNNVFRLLATLEESGYIEQCQSSEEYRLGAGCLELGSAYRRGHDLIRCARPVLEELSQNLGETAHLAVLRGFEVVHLDGVQPSQLIVTTSRTGLRLPVHCTALGKVLLASSEPAVREEFSNTLEAGRQLDGRTPSTITDHMKFLEHLQSVAVQGYGVDLEECEPGLRCAAAPVWDACTGAWAAISVSGPAFRLSDDRLHGEVVGQITEAAGRLSGEMVPAD
jgi:IclR family KDG regulon transcriptional repressor